MARATDATRAARASATAGAPLDPLAQLRAKLPPPHAPGVLSGVPVEVLARLGISAIVLRDRFGVGIDKLTAVLDCTVEDLAILGVCYAS